MTEAIQNTTSQDIAKLFDKAAKRKIKRAAKPSPRITLRLTHEEREQIDAMAGGLTTSAFIRERVFGNETIRRKRNSHRPVADQQSMAKALALLGASRIASNLNQLAYHANTGTLDVDDAVIAQLDEAYAYVREMRDTLISAIGLIER